ncbi:MAG TPA: SMC family ATPase, partial [Actinomycetota bacterium]|nr:SMC family ATPase [Actinomycetota bacterium]
MRPLTLRIKGFTSFRDEQTIDFTGLDLFALWGPTGSGKSSVLDAMTYALYGRVDRVEHASALVSQGQPRMSVSFDFSADGRSYRVTRSTPPTKVRLERLDESGRWASFGPGADKVTEVNRSLIGLIGLDYLAFTRSVMLPQGKFAEFLAGEAADRRKILTELLGLELFDKMAKRANEIRKEQASQADIKEDVVGRSFTGVDPESIADAKSGLDAAAKQGGRVAAVLVEVERLGEELAHQKASTEAMLACRTEVATLAATFEGHAARLGDIAREGASFLNELDRASKAVAIAAESFETAAAEKGRAEKRWGSVDTLVALTERAKHLDEVTVTAARADGSLTEARARAKQGSLGIDSATGALEKAQGVEATAAKELARCSAAVDEAHRHDRVGALVHGKATGDPCPICERPLETIPSFDASEHEAAAAARASAETNHREALARVNEATTALAVARKGHASALEQINRCEEALNEARSKQSALADELAPAFGKSLPDDPAGELEQRVHAVRQLVAAEGAARTAHEAACAELAAFDERRRALKEKTAEIRTRMD